ncbi:TPA: hypothetical protein QCN90_001109 [Bacillus pacificus]|nr:hypothetical protein [Bacillus pacificus]
MSNKFDKDFEAITENKELTEGATKFIEALREFVGDKYDSEDLAKLIVLIMASLNANDDTFNEAVSILYKVNFEVQMGIELEELLEFVGKYTSKTTH